MKSIRPKLCFRILKRLINLTVVVGKTVLATPNPYFHKSCVTGSSKRVWTEDYRDTGALEERPLF